MEASSVSRVWLSVPRPGRAATTTGRPSRAASDAMSTPSEKGTSAPPAASTTTRSYRAERSS